MKDQKFPRILEFSEEYSKLQMSTLQRLSLMTSRQISRGFSSSSVGRLRKVVQEHDVVFLKNTGNANAAEIITHPLRRGKEHVLGRKDFSKDTVRHDDIIGKIFRDTVKTRKGVGYRILEPTLAEYTDGSPRLVTPIYSQDANLIVSLLDLHPTVPGENGAAEERLEIFEAGTGHGALTLNLARAIHAANTAAPARFRDQTSIEENATANETSEYKTWRQNRRAVIHTLDNSEQHSRHAEKVVQNFRRGMYYGGVDFHVGSINEYVEERLRQTSNRPFFQYAILDLPAIEDYFEVLGRALKPNGMLLTFCPSITQITSVVLKMKSDGSPMWLEKVVEIGAGIGVGGRDWDVRPVKPRAILKAEMAAPPAASEHSEVIPEAIREIMRAGELDEKSRDQDNGWSMVCRPRAGSKVIGGGFVAVWRRMADPSKSFTFVPTTV